jgi:predicted permease
MGAWTQSIGVDGAAPATAGQSRTFFNIVSPGYFATIGQRLLRGRDFGPQDQPGSPRVCIITESVARAFFSGRDPVGRHISAGLDASRQNLEIAGVVRDAKYQRLQETASRIVYLPHLQNPEFLNASSLIAEVRAGVPPASLIQPLRRELRALDPDVVARFEPLSGRLRESLVIERVVAVISGFLGTVALLLAAAGLYGLLAYSVSLRTAEIGVRMALGASQASVRRLLLKDALALTAAGALGGCGAALLLARFAGKVLYGVAPNDPWALAAATVMMLAVAFAAAAIPTRRASRIDPMAALRHQ